MKHLFCFIMAVVSLCVKAEDVYWVNAGSGSWGDAENWSNGKVPDDKKYRVFVTNETAVTVTLASSIRVGAIVFSGANHSLDNNGWYFSFEKNDEDPSIDVADGIEVAVDGLKPWSGDMTTRLVKKGAGTLRTLSIIGTVETRFSELEIAEGNLKLDHSGGDVVRPGRILVRGGAKVDMLRSNQIQNQTIIELEEGAVFDFHDQRDTIGGFVGSGVVTNLSTSVTTMTCGPLEFSGRFFGRNIGIGPFDENAVEDVDEGCLIVGASNTFADITVNLYSSAVFTNVLRFAAGIGDFYVKALSFDGTAGSQIILEDVEGNPVRVHAAFIDDLKEEVVAGKGDLVLLGPGTYTFTNDTYRATGTLTVGNGTVKAGNAQEGYDAVGLEGLARIDVPSDKTFGMKNYGDAVWGETPCITGSGTVNFDGPGAWTIGNLSVTGGTLTVTGEGAATNLTLAGGCSTDFNYVPPDGFTTYITGGEYRFKKTIDVSGTRRFHQSGGSVYGTLQASGASSGSEIFWTMTGGYLRSYTDNDIHNYPQGIGLDLSGNAVVELRNTSGWEHRLSSGGRSHTIRLRDNAWLGVDDFSFGEAGCDATGTIQLDGGVFAAAGKMNPLVAMTESSTLYANVNLNGGVLRSEYQGNVSWCSVEDMGHIKLQVQKKGGTLEVKRENPAESLVLTWPVVSDVGEGEVDGGLRKTGYGSLVLDESCEIDGPLTVDCGILVSRYAGKGNPVGRGDIVVSNAEISVRGSVACKACSNDSARFVYGGAAVLSLGGETSLTIGKAGATTSPFVRNGHGVLGISSDTVNSAIGENAVATVNGGLELDAKTGLPKAPIFERRRLNLTSTTKEISNGFLTLDADNRLVRKEPVNFDPATSTSATVAQIKNSSTAAGAAITIADDAAVGALLIDLMNGKNSPQIADGKTLSIGSGEAGSVAPLVLNAMYVGDNGYISIKGGTVDFGASEGVILLNRNHSANTYSRISSKISGSGGLTVAAFRFRESELFPGYLSLEAANDYTGGTWIENAMVSIMTPTSLGAAGDVHIGGNALYGGALVFHSSYTGSSFDRNLFLSGKGPLARVHSTQNYGKNAALMLRKTVRFTGTLTLVGDSSVSVSGVSANSPVTFAGSVVGDGALTLDGAGSLRLSAANTYKGGTVVSSGVLEVDDAGTLGTGPVEVCEGAELRFVNASAKNVPNVITGGGRITCAGAAVAFSDVSGFSGPIEGPGSVSGSEGLELKNDVETIFTEKLDYSGDTVVSAGILRLGGLSSMVPPAADAISFRLDASCEESLDLKSQEDGSNRVLSWADADGRDVVFTNQVEYAPELVTDHAEGRPTVYFDGTLGRRLTANVSSPEMRTVAMVTKVGSSSHPSGWGNAGLIGFNNTDLGLRMLERRYLKADSMFFDGKIWADGVSSMQNESDFAKIDLGETSKLRTLKAESIYTESGGNLAVGGYFVPKNYNRSYFGDIAELIVYDRVLSEAEHDALERYFAGRWDLEYPESVSTNVLPTATALEIAAGATVDLAGGYQEVASLSGAGTLANDGDRRATLRISSGTSSFTGSFRGDIHLEIAAGATLDLGGGAITVAALGGSGTIVNGTVTVTEAVYPGGEDTVGTLTFGTGAQALFAAGAKLVVDGERVNGTVDLLSFAGSVDISGLELDVPAPGDIVIGSHDVVVADDGVSGTFGTLHLPARAQWSVEYSETAAKLCLKNGMILIVR